MLRPHQREQLARGESNIFTNIAAGDEIRVENPEQLDEQDKVSRELGKVAYESFDDNLMEIEDLVDHK